MASDLGDGDYLGAYRRFFVDFLDKVDPDDPLPIKTSGHDVTEGEIAGETVHMTLQYLNQELCPPSLQCYIVQQVVEEIKAICRKEPETCGFRQEEKIYAPLKLMQAITSKVNEICHRYLENSRLALLPPPPSTPMPLATAYAIRNTRRKMEDRHVILHDLNAIFNIKDDSVASYYAVFDGHAGYQAAVYCSAHLHQYLAESRHYPTDPERALRDAFITTDALFIQKSTRQTLSSGTTAVCALIMKKKLYVAWAGDSQAALAKRGAVSQLVNPHKPDRNDERERVEEMGGTVMHLGTWRVNGNLAVSRAIGDAQYKPYVTADPEIRCITLDGQEDFLIIGCDGLWDCVTENEAATVVYRELYRDPYDYDTVSQRLVEYAKGQGSDDNITVIVVFLTSPNKIASRPQYGNPLLADVQLDNMEPDNRFMSNTNGQYDVNSPFVKQPLEKDVSPDLMDDEDPYGGYGNKSNNGMHHENGGSVGVPVTDYDAEDDEDLGPETDVDAVDDVSEPIPTLANVSRQLFPEKQDPCELYQAEEGIDDDSPPSPHAKKTNQQALIPDADNVADSEDSEDEWNYYRIEPNKEKDSAGAAGFSPVPKEDNKIVDNVVVSSSPSDHGDNQEIEKEQEESTKNDTDSSSSESESEREIPSSVLIDAEISPDNEFQVNPTTTITNLTESEEKDNQEEQQEENKSEEEDMDFQLNPNAAEFVPVSPTPIIATRTELDAPIAGSPLKQTALMDDIKIPSRREFQNEVRHRPGEIEEKSNGQLLADLEDCTMEKSEAASRFNMLDVSEVSSTKAEFGDESSFLTASELHRTGASNLDGSYTDSYNAFEDSSIDPMTASFGPGDFMTLSNPVDLNAVHDLTDADLIADENGEQEGVEEDKINQLNIEKSTGASESGYLFHSTVENLPEEQTGGNIMMNSSSPMSSPQPTDLHHDVLTFDNETDIRDHNIDAALSEKPPTDLVEEKYIIDSTIVDSEHEQPDSEQHTNPVLDDETNVTSKLLEMDLEDRGSQDCEFEKCNEKLRVESPMTSDEPMDLITTALTSDEPADLISSTAVNDEHTDLIVPSAPSDETADLISPSLTPDEPVDLITTTVTKENFVETCTVPESLPVSSVTIDESHISEENLEKPEVEKLVESFNDLQFNDASQTTAVPHVEVLHNPLDLNVESSSLTTEDNLILDYSANTDYIVAKAPESPGVAISPLVEHQSNNPFANVESSEIPASHTDETSTVTSGMINEFGIIEAMAQESKSAETQQIDDFGKFEVMSEKEKPTETQQIDNFGTFEIMSEKEKPETQQIDEFGIFEDISQKEKTEIQETPLGTEEAINISTGLKLSESLQEFTGLEQQLNPEKVTNGLVSEDNLLDVHNEVSKDVDLVVNEIAKEIVPEVEEKFVEKEVDQVTSTEPIVTVNETVVEPESKSENASVVTAAAVATAAAAGTVAAAAAVKATKAKPTSKTAQKPTPGTKAATNKSTPTSPTKAAGTATRTASGVKKTASSTAAARPNKLETGTKSNPTNVVGSKATTAMKSTLNAPKTTGRVSASSPRAKLPSTATTAKTATSSVADKKPTTNGEITKSSTTTTTRAGSATARLSSKPLVKSSAASARTPLASTVSPKPKGTTATATTNKAPSKTGTVGTTTQRPKTAPAGGATSLAAKSRLASTGNSTTTANKFPITEKQIKETANKQISSSRTSTTTTASKTSRTSVTSSTTTTSRRVGASKTTTTSSTTSATVPPPIRKPQAISRPGAKTTPANTKTNATKVTSTCTEKTKAVVQNGVCKATQETKIVTSATVTRTGDSNEEDVPIKDLSPVELPTDNQLIMTAD